MHLKVSSSLEETVEMVWRLRTGLSRIARLFMGAPGAETLDPLSDAELREKGLSRRPLVRVVAEERDLPPARRTPTASGLDAFADPFESRMPFARRRVPHLVVVKTGRGARARGVRSAGETTRTHDAA